MPMKALKGSTAIPPPILNLGARRRGGGAGGGCCQRKYPAVLPPGESSFRLPVGNSNRLLFSTTRYA
jgi:hypothetical protein